MAKKRKKSSTLGLALSAGAVLFAIVAVCMLFVNAVTVDLKLTDVNFTGAQLAFGYKETIGSKDIEILSFSFMNLLPYLLALGGGVVAVLAALGKKSFLLNVIATACFVAAAIFFFTATAYITVAKTAGEGVLNQTWKSVVDAIKDSENVKLAIGSILGGVFSIVAAACSALKIFLK